MANFTFSYDAERGQKVSQFQAKLLDISAQPVGTFPSGKAYRVGTVQFENFNGQTISVTCIVNEANYAKGMSVGNTYLCSAILRDGQTSPLLVCSHLVGAARASMDDFGFGAAETATIAGTPVVNANPLVVA
jgi:hypothetical protein